MELNSKKKIRRSGENDIHHDIGDDISHERQYNVKANNFCSKTWDRN